MKSIIKNFIKSSGFNLKKVSELKKETNKLLGIKNKNEKINELKDLIKKFPKYPNFYYLLARELYYQSDPSFFELLNIYGDKRNQWLRDTGLEVLDIEFIQPPVFIGSIGNFYALENLIRANNIGLRDKKKLIYILPKKAKLTNSILAEYFEKYVKIIKDDFDTGIEDFASSLSLPLGLCVPMKRECLYLDIAANKCESEEKKNKINSSILKLQDKHLNQGKEILKKMGLPKDAWYVTLHVREPGYKGETSKNTNEGFRNSSPLNYLKAIGRITKSGGWVFRMGDSSMTPLPEMKNLIDYARSNFKSEMMDIFLAATSRFCIGTASGFFRIPRYFGVPVIFTNSAFPMPYYSLKSNDLYLPKLIKKKSTNKFQTFKEIMSFPSILYQGEEAFKEQGLSFIENSSEEIDLSVKEMMEVNFSSNKINLTNEQVNFKNIVEININKHNNSVEAFARCSKNFLEKHPNLLN
jgi:putative glycosyltransferase (TIGR04372 family)